MTLTLNDRIVSQTVIDVARLTITRELVRQIPSTRIGVVEGAPDTAARKVDVRLNGSSEISAGFVYGAHEPRDGDLVRVIIDPKGDRYVDEILGGALVRVGDGWASTFESDFIQVGHLDPVTGLGYVGVIPVLKLATERPWQFESTGTGAATALQLRTLVGGKTFQIAGSDGTVPWSVSAADAGGLSRLTLGTNTVTKAGGTAFPTGPVAGDQFFRTDYNMNFRYDGTRWTCTCQHELVMPFRTADNYAATTPDAWRVGSPMLAGVVGMWVEDIHFLFYVGGGTLSGSNFWTITFAYHQLGAGVNVTIGTFTINSGAVTQYRRGSVAAGIAVAAANLAAFYADIAPTGTIGVLYIWPVITYRWIVA